MERKKLSAAKLRQYLPLYLMMLPALIYLFINNYIPMAGIVVAFKKFNANDGMFGSPWAGFTNFTYLFGSNDTAIIIRNTLLYNVAFIIVNTVAGIMLAAEKTVPECGAATLPYLYRGSQLYCVCLAEP